MYKFLNILYEGKISILYRAAKKNQPDLGSHPWTLQHGHPVQYLT